MIRRYPIVLCLMAQWLIPAGTPACAADARTFKERIEAGGELKYVSGVPVLFLQGTPAEMGRQQGLLITEAARPLVALPKQFMSEAPWAIVVPLCRIPARARGCG